MMHYLIRTPRLFSDEADLIPVCGQASLHVSRVCAIYPATSISNDFFWLILSTLSEELVHESQDCFATFYAGVIFASCFYCPQPLDYHCFVTCALVYGEHFGGDLSCASSPSL